MNTHEFNQIKESIVKMAVETLGITEKAASLRVDALLKSDIMSKFGSPSDQSFRIAIDAAMQIPQLGIGED